MKLFHRLSLLAVPMLLAAVTSSAAPPVEARSRIVDAFAKLPLRFERNDGQTAREVAYLSRGRGSTLFLTSTEAVLSLRDRKGPGAKTAVLRLRLAGANASPAIAGEEPLQGKINYFTGNDRSRWRTAVPTYRRVRYDDVWPGIDLVWHGMQNALEYDFIVAPGVDPSDIRLKVDGAQRLRLDASGNLIAETAAGDVVQHAPKLYQDGSEGRIPVVGRYVLRGRREVGFEIGAYDATRTLVIDPILEYSTFLGGALNEEAFGVAVDAEGSAYVTGPTDSLAFPKSILLNDEIHALVFIAKLNADGTDLLYASLIGTNETTEGFQFEEGSDALIATGIAVTADGKACITGGVENFENKSKYPVTDNAFQTSGFCLGFCEEWRRGHGVDAFVTMLSADGQEIVYSTFYGGGKYLQTASFERGDAIAVDDAGRIYITGTANSNDLPTRNAFQPSRASSLFGSDAFIAVFDPTQKRGRDTLLYASFLGGTADDRGLGIAVDADRNAYVVGHTSSIDLQTKAPAGQGLPPLQGTFRGGQFDGFVAKIDTEAVDASSLTYLTYFGGNRNDRVEAVAVDASQRAYIAGATNSDPATFALVNAFDITQTNGEGFVAKLNADGTALFYSSFLGGDNANTTEDFEEATGIAIDSFGSAYVTGNTSSGDSFPTGRIDGPFAADQSGTAFVAKIGPSTSGTAVPPLVYSTTFGGKGAKARGIAVDSSLDAYVAGFTDGDFPVTANAFQTSSGGGRDAFVAKIGTVVGDTTGLYDSKGSEFQLRNSNTTGGADLVVPFGRPGDLPVVGDWDGDGVTDAGVFRQDPGEFVLRLGSGAVVTIIAGNLGELPLAGDWDGDGFDTLGLYRPAGRDGQAFFLTNTHVEDSISPDFDIFVPGGQLGDLPLGGDWDGDGLDTVAFFRPSTTTFFQIDDFTAGVARSFVFGAPGDLPLAGDWEGNGTDDVGVFRPSDRTMRLTLDFGVTTALVFELQAPGDVPVGGNWDGN
ncbi:MAG TPA: SBBP repeat-containing protein [Thermoanaerobaculia bacterium]|nr:SBBP repeat-containing protein [Thermoanaerobaculia bacterium]